MRIHLLAALVALAATGCIYERDVVRERPVSRASAPPPPPADEGDEAVAAAPPVEREVDTEVFYERLSPYGHWQYVEDYGRVWVPTVAVAWRPYYYGHWVLTDWGWTFASDDPWGWAAYHYGSWGFGPGIGWYWVPGRIWAPAWVSWRYGGGYVTWCPLGPRGYVYGYESPAWVAVREQHFTQPIATVAVGPRATPVAVQGAAPLAGPQASPARGASFGPPVARVAAATGQQLRPVSAASAVAPRGVPAGAAAKIDRMGGNPGPRAAGQGADGRAGGWGRGAANDGGPVARSPAQGGRGAAEGSPRASGGSGAPGSARPSDGGGRAAPRARGSEDRRGGEARPAPAERPRAWGGGEARPSGGGGGGYRPAPARGGGGGGGYHPAPSGGGSHPAPSGVGPKK